MEGILLANKPPGLTSHDVVEIVRRKLGIQRIGHTGTLDPMAEGLLVLLVGRATRYQQSFQHQEKTYEGVIQLGSQTDTADAAGSFIRHAPIPPLNPRHVAEVLSSFEGALVQTPPRYSAVKVRGRPAYWWTRRQVEVTLKPRTVHLAEVRLIACDAQTITCRVHCSAGTYLRVMAEQVAERLGTVGHLAKLVRLGIGPWRLEDAKTLSWIKGTSAETLSEHLLAVNFACP